MKKLVLLPVLALALVLGGTGCIVIPSSYEGDYGHHHRDCDDDSGGGLRVRPR